MDNSRDDMPNFEETDLDSLAEAVAEANPEPSEEERFATIPLAEYEKLKADLDAANDRALRALAELENFRNRTARLAQEERKYASLDLIRDMLPVWDNLGLALSIEEPDKNGQAVVEGVRMVRDEFAKTLEKRGVKKIDALHKPFDPNFCESVAFAASDEYPPNTVIVELKAGFTLYDRVVRAAQVVLASPKKEPETREESAE
ncbi:MAG: nucleotide exchange factor GrpE [Thermoguttaceae bacterium]|nr:nucleotide exchange factor GrpE [Thermoguttaceae bacterium]